MSLGASATARQSPSDEEEGSPMPLSAPGQDGTPSPVGSVDKALILLEILAGAGPEGMTLRDIAEAGGMKIGRAHV